MKNNRNRLDRLEGGDRQEQIWSTTEQRWKRVKWVTIFWMGHMDHTNDRITAK